MSGRIDALFPDCCHRCAHLERPDWTCQHDFSQLLRQEFALDPNRPCPVSSATE
jgi:hypothetical protein